MRALVTWALAGMARERGMTAATIGGVGAALFLVLFLDGVFAGVSERIVDYVREAGADVWVMEDGVFNMHMATSMLPEERASDVAAVPGVASTSSILYVTASLRAGDEDHHSYVVGLSRRSARGGPWKMRSGQSMPGRGEAIIPVEIGARDAIDVGGEVEVLGKKLRVVGLSAGAFSMANSITFVAEEDLADMLSMHGRVSYVLVEAEPGVAPAELAARIRREVSGVNALPRDEFVENDREMARQMGAEVLGAMRWIALVVGGLIAAFAVHAGVARKQRQVGIALALGYRSRAVETALALQAVLTVVAGFAAALLLTIAVAPLIEALVPELSIMITAGAVARLGAGAALTGALAAILPAWMAARVDPAIVFRE